MFFFYFLFCHLVTGGTKVTGTAEDEEDDEGVGVEHTHTSSLSVHTG